MNIRDEVYKVMRVLGGGVLKKPGTVPEFVLAARQRGYAKVASWVETHPSEYQVLLVAAAGLLEEPERSDSTNDDDDEED